MNVKDIQCTYIKNNNVESGRVGSIPYIFNFGSIP